MPKGKACLLGQALRASPGRFPLPAPVPGAAACLVSHLGLTERPHAKRLIGLLREGRGLKAALGGAGTVLKRDWGVWVCLIFFFNKAFRLTPLTLCFPLSAYSCRDGEAKRGGHSGTE